MAVTVSGAAVELAPVIGDPLTVVAGIMREPLLRFLLIVGIAKTGRYIVVALLALQWL